MANEYSRNLRDARFSTTKAFPAAGASNATERFDLEQRQGGEIETIDAELVIPALPNNIDPAKVLTLTLEDSADGTNFLPTDPAIVSSVAGVATTGSAAKTVRFRFPPTTRRYIRVKAAVPTGGGDHTGASYGFSLLF